MPRRTPPITQAGTGLVVGTARVDTVGFNQDEAGPSRNERSRRASFVAGCSQMFGGKVPARRAGTSIDGRATRISGFSK